MTDENRQKIVGLDRARRLYLQQAPMALLFDELKIAAKAGELSWLCPTFQEQVAAELIDSKVAQRFPPRRSYVSRFTKLFLEECELEGEEMAEAILRARMSCISARGDGSPRDEEAFQSFNLPLSGKEGEEEAFLSFRVADQDNEVGLRVWEAGRVLADFCLAHCDLVRGKRVLELGSGVGVTGMLIAGCCGASEVILTDYAPRVLENLRFNLEINGSVLRSRTSASTVSVRALDWTDYTSCALGAMARSNHLPRVEKRPVSAEEETSEVPGAHSRTRSESCSSNPREDIEHPREAQDDSLGTPQVVLAADVVYDIRFHVALVGLILETLRRCPDTLIVLASTLRNVHTMQAFHDYLDQAAIPWRSVDFPASTPSQPSAYLDSELSGVRLGKGGLAADSSGGVPEGRASGEGDGCKSSLGAVPTRESPEILWAQPTGGALVPDGNYTNELWRSSSVRSSRQDGSIDEDYGTAQEESLAELPRNNIQSSSTERLGLGVWSHPGDINSVQLCVCGRSAATWTHRTRTSPSSSSARC